MKKENTILLIGFWLSACASLMQGDRATMPFEPDISKEVETLVKNMDFSSAKKRVLAEKDRGRWCNFFNTENRCYTPSPEDAPDKLLKWVTDSEDCFNVLGLAEQPSETREDAAEMETRAYKACNFFGVPDGLESRHKLVNEKLHKEAATGKFKGVLKSGNINPVASAQNKCIEGLRWGYYALNEIKNSRNEPVLGAWGGGLEHLRGQFQSKDKCEEARLLDPTSSNHPYSVGGCRQRYLGKPIEVELTELTYMHNKSGTPQKESIHFTNSSECERARSTGLQLEKSARGGAIAIRPVGDKDAPRFMGHCTEVKLSVCNRDDAEPNKIEIAR